MADFRNKRINVEFDRVLIGSFEIDNDLKLVANKNVTWEADIEEFQIKNTKGIKFKDYEISYFFLHLELNDEVPGEMQGELYAHCQAVIKINDDECYYDPHQKKFFYLKADEALEFNTWEEVLDAIENKMVIIETIKF